MLTAFNKYTLEFPSSLCIPNHSAHPREARYDFTATVLLSLVCNDVTVERPWQYR